MTGYLHPIPKPEKCPSCGSFSTCLLSYSRTKEVHYCRSCKELFEVEVKYEQDK